MPPIVPTIFFEFDARRVVLFVLFARIVAIFTLGAFERHDQAIFFLCHAFITFCVKWSLRRDLNPGPRSYQERALPTELRRRGGFQIFKTLHLQSEILNSLWGGRDSDSHSRTASILQTDATHHLRRLPIFCFRAGDRTWTDDR